MLVHLPSMLRVLCSTLSMKEEGKTSFQLGWWHYRPVIPALKKSRQEGREFKVNPEYILSSRTV